MAWERTLPSHTSDTMLITVTQTLDALQSDTKRPSLLRHLASLPSTRPSRKPLKHGVAPAQAKGSTTELAPVQPPSSLNSPALHRPYPVVSGRRHVPKFIDANRAPMLLFKKPQSPRMSGILRHIINRRTKQQTQMAEMGELVGLSRNEDLWDEILESELGVGPGKGPSWRFEAKRIGFKTKIRFWQEQQRLRLIAKKMTWIVKEEANLARKEKEEGRSKDPREWRRYLELMEGKTQEQQKEIMIGMRRKLLGIGEAEEAEEEQVDVDGTPLSGDADMDASEAEELEYPLRGIKVGQGVA